MKKLLLIIAIITTSIYAIETGSPNKGQKIYVKKLKKITGINGAKMAAKHSQEEWEELFEGKGDLFISELSKDFPKKVKFFKNKKFKKYLPDLKAFFIEYANDSGNIPSC
jgi:hypothetical protein